MLGFKRYETIWIWLHKLRVAMVRPGRERLSGAVEVDETYIGGERPGKRGRGAAGKSLVLVAVEDKGKQIGRIRLKRIPDASAASLMMAVKESVEPGRLVRTDGGGGYGRLPAEAYEHTIVRKSADVGENLLPLVSLTDRQDIRNLLRYPEHSAGALMTTDYVSVQAELTVAEAMWKGKPVVGGDTGGIRLQVVDDHTGFLVATPEGAALRIRYLLNDRERRLAMGAKAREFVRQHFLLTRHLREYLAHARMTPSQYEEARQA